MKFFENKTTISGILSQSCEFRGRLSIEILGFGKIATSKEKKIYVCLQVGVFKQHVVLGKIIPLGLLCFLMMVEIIFILGKKN